MVSTDMKGSRGKNKDVTLNNVKVRVESVLNFTYIMQYDINILPSVDSKYLPWSGWSDCSVSCGPGTRNRMRVCLPAKGGGRNCANGPIETEVEKCQLDLCPSKLCVHESML